VDFSGNVDKLTPTLQQSNKFLIAVCTNMDDGSFFPLILIIVVIFTFVVFVALIACRRKTLENASACKNANRSALHSLTKSNNTSPTKHTAKSKVANDVKTSIDITHLTAGDSSKESKPLVTSVDDGNGHKSTGPQARRRPSRRQCEHSTGRNSDSSQNCVLSSHSAAEVPKAGA
jgi:mannitol-specific phosphotransferase system IIBC component